MCLLFATYLLTYVILIHGKDSHLSEFVLKSLFLRWNFSATEFNKIFLNQTITYSLNAVYQSLVNKTKSLSSLWIERKLFIFIKKVHFWKVNNQAKIRLLFSRGCFPTFYIQSVDVLEIQGVSFLIGFFQMGLRARKDYSFKDFEWW